jgi:hypothetical protein
VKRWFWLFKALTVAGLLALWGAVWSVDLRVKKREKSALEVVKSGRKRLVSERRDRKKGESDHERKEFPGTGSSR